MLATSTAQPTLLALPFAMASLGWAGGLVVLLVSGAVTVYCNILLARLFEFGGRRNTRYRDLAKRTMGGWIPGAAATALLPLPPLPKLGSHLRQPDLTLFLAHVFAGERHPYAYQLVLIPQFTVIVGVGVANLILAAQCLQAVDSLYSGGECARLTQQPELQFPAPLHH